MKSNNEIKIGIMVVIVGAILAAMTIQVGNFNLKKEGYSLRVRFNDIDGVNLNSPVMFNGYEIGVVDDILIVNDNDQIKMELVLWLDKKAKLRKGSKAYIKNLGFMGEKYVGLLTSNSTDEVLSEGSLITGQEPPNFDELIRKGSNIANEVNGIVSNLNERLKTNTTAVDNILVNTNTTMQNMSSAVGNVNQILEENKRDIKELVSNLNALSVNLEELTGDLKEHPWKILYKSKEKPNKPQKEE